MYEFLIAVVLLLALCVAGFFFWRAHQLGIAGRAELTHPWFGPPPPGIEALVPQFAKRDLAFACGCLLFVALTLWAPRRFPGWLLMLIVFGAAHYGYTRYVVARLAGADGQSTQR